MRATADRSKPARRLAVSLLAAGVTGDARLAGKLLSRAGPQYLARVASPFRYFAYGSNMLTPRLRARCPSATVTTIASVSGRTLAFAKRSTDDSGKATLAPAAPQRSVLGVVFEIAESEAAALRAAEGPGYRLVDEFAVACLRTGEILATRTFLAVARDPALKPYDWYLALLLAGIAEHGLGDDYAARCRAFAYDIDRRYERPERLAAMEALAQSGIDDYAPLLATGGGA